FNASFQGYLCCAVYPAGYRFGLFRWYRVQVIVVKEVSKLAFLYPCALNTRSHSLKICLQILDNLIPPSSIVSHNSSYNDSRPVSRPTIIVAYQRGNNKSSPTGRHVHPAGTVKPFVRTFLVLPG